MRPFAGDTPAELLRAHLFQPPIAFAQSDPRARSRPSCGRRSSRRSRRSARTVSSRRRTSTADRPDPAAAGPQRSRAHARGPGAAAGGPAVDRRPDPQRPGRLNEQFAPGKTPLPSEPHLTLAPTVSATSALGGAPTEPMPRAPRQIWVWALLAAAAVTLAALLLRQGTARPTAAQRGRDAALAPHPRRVRRGGAAFAALARACGAHRRTDGRAHGSAAAGEGGGARARSSRVRARGPSAARAAGPLRRR